MENSERRQISPSPLLKHLCQFDAGGEPNLRSCKRCVMIGRSRMDGEYGKAVSLRLYIIIQRHGNSLKVKIRTLFETTKFCMCGCDCRSTRRGGRGEGRNENNAFRREIARLTDFPAVVGPCLLYTLSAVMGADTCPQRPAPALQARHAHEFRMDLLSEAVRTDSSYL